MTEAQLEVLVVLMEECGEVIQRIGKILRFGPDATHPRKPELGTNQEALCEEIAHVMAATQLCAKYDMVDGALIDEERRRKLATIDDYLHHASAEDI